MNKLILICALVLAGCATTPATVPNVAIKYKYVISTIPDELLQVPPVAASIDVNTATDKDTAVWMINWEQRYQEIEARLKLIKAYQDRKLKELNLPPEDVIKN